MKGHEYMSGEDVERYLMSGTRRNKKRRIRYYQGKQKIIKSAGSICLKTGWKVDIEKYRKIYKSSPNAVGNIVP